MRVVNSLKPEYENQIKFAVADQNTAEGRNFAAKNNVGIVTLVFFKADGSKIISISGVHKEEFLRKTINRAFNLNQP